MALIYVIIPVYNMKRFLREAVDSVLNQPCKNIEIILVNDGSTDGSAELCDELASVESRISVIHQQNMGVSVARNKGIEEVLMRSTADGFIAFLDADDAWYPDVFSEEITERLKQNPDDLFVFDAVHSNLAMTRYSKPYGNTKDETMTGKASVWKVNSHFGALMYPISNIDKFTIRFKEGLCYAEDLIFRMQNVFLSETVNYCKECLYIYRGNPGSAMGKADMIPSIEYFTPIIDGWIWSDDFINGNMHITGRESNIGQVMASIYLAAMAERHFLQAGSRKEIMKTLYSHPHFSLLRDMRPPDISDVQYNYNKLLLEKTMLFQLKYLLHGFVRRSVRMLQGNHDNAKREDIDKYPFAELPKK